MKGFGTIFLKEEKCKKFYSKKANARRFTANKQTRGVLGQTSEGTQWVLGESDTKGFDGERIRSLIFYPKAL